MPTAAKVLVNRIGFHLAAEERGTTPEAALQWALNHMVASGHRLITVSILRTPYGEYEAFIVSEVET